MKTLNLPKSWVRMNFRDQQYYLVNTHQAKDLSKAAAIITKLTNDRVRAALAEAHKRINAEQAGNAWYNRD